MTKLTLLASLAFLTVAFYFNCEVSATSDEYIDAKRRDGEKKYAPLWFGPRIGRRKRNPSENSFKTLDRDEMETYAAALKNPWPFVAISNGKRQMDFTPRLGRDSNEEEEVVEYDDFIRHKPLIPRVGRRVSQYIPRLGRENDVLLQ